LSAKGEGSVLRVFGESGRSIVLFAVINIQHLLFVGVVGFIEISIGRRGLASGFRIFNDDEPKKSLVRGICGSRIRWNGGRKLGSRSLRTRCLPAWFQLFAVRSSCLSSQFALPVNLTA
jgi:hypothetical protein